MNNDTDHLKIISLNERPHLKEKTIKLIEECFEYTKSSFAIDFYPLINDNNLNNCFIVLSENEPIAHIGISHRKLNLFSIKYPISLIGGVCVNNNFRGKGIFRKLITHASNESKKNMSIFSLLWSDQSEIYNKLSFFECGEQISTGAQDIDESELFKKGWKKTKYSFLSDQQKKEIHEIYNDFQSKNFCYLERNSQHWSEIEKITSSDLFLKNEDGLIQNYFFINKGHDLENIIYEIGANSSYLNNLQELKEYKVWLPRNNNIYEKSNELMYFALMSIGETSGLSDFLSNMFNIELKIENTSAQNISFRLNQKIFSVSKQEFLQLFLGPNIAKELNQKKSIFISGLDSI